MTDKPEVPERIWYSPEWNICHKTKQSYNSKADITFGVEFINAESLKELRGVWEKWIEYGNDLLYPDVKRDTYETILFDTWIALDNLSKKMGWSKKKI